MNQSGNLYRLITILLGCLGILSQTKVFAAPNPADQWRTGADFRKQLELPVSVQWSGQELRTALKNLSTAQHIPIFLDRRVDPGQTLELKLSDVPLLTVLQEIAAQQNLGMAIIYPVVYLGPKEAATDIRTLSALAWDEAMQVPQEKRSPLLSSETMSWPDLAKPKDLIAQTAKQAGVLIVGLEKVPHDLWPAASWPAMNLIDRLTLLAIGFDLQVRVSKDGSALALVPRVSPAKIVRHYPGGSSPEQLLQQLTKQFPEAEFKLAAGKLYVRGRMEDQELVQAKLSGQPVEKKQTSPQPAPLGTKVYTLNVQNKPLGPIVKALAKQMNLQLSMDEVNLRDAGIDLSAPISFDVKESTIEELWETALQSTGLTFQLEGNQLKVFPISKE